eukprot:m.226540 g.226540  ORF g.226540 m.226540 type:complete len:135 (+) comp15169_c0_seq33:1455-1859(+)
MNDSQQRQIDILAEKLEGERLARRQAERQLAKWLVDNGRTVEDMQQIDLQHMRHQVQMEELKRIIHAQRQDIHKMSEDAAQVHAICKEDQQELKQLRQKVENLDQDLARASHRLAGDEVDVVLFWCRFSSGCSA